ncbi:MAG TPA: NlpC/P60 family protein [Caulobacteraceae bacterium]|nr:NlpC/P60 family protein [Caulobacteraceae bacterium]
MSFDPRITLAYNGAADSRLQGILAADRFAAVSPRQLVSPVTAIHSTPDAGAEQLDQILFGERFDVLETKGRFAFGQAARDGYVGWVDGSQLSETIATPTHWVCAPSTLAFAEASIKTASRGPIPLNALVTIDKETETLARDPRLGWIPRPHLLPIGAQLADPAAAALVFLGAPYLWGGRGGGGIDCSGLVQQALLACGQTCPRDSDQQEAIGEPAPEAALVRGDLVFWNGHVAMMIDAKRMVHANAFHMAVAVEPLAKACGRISERAGGDPIAFRRPGI